MSQKAIENFKARHSSFVSFASKLKPLLEDLLTQSGIKFHFVEARAKTVESFAEKLGRSGKNYLDPLNDITDLVGTRIVLYYADDIEKCGDLITREFKVDEVEKTHQPTGLPVDQFGYLSMHYIVLLGAHRKELLEWKSFSEIKCEIQVRTVLQHSWAAVSHALQYKREGDVPHDLRRKLHRLAGLFELADEEFLQLRNLSALKADEAAAAIASGNDKVRIDASSITAFVGEWKYIRECLKKLESMGIVAPDEISPAFRDYVGAIVEHCDRIGFQTIGELRSALSYDPDAYLREISEPGWYMNDEFVLYLLLIGSRPEAFTAGLLVESSGWSRDIAEKVTEAARRFGAKSPGSANRGKR